MANLDAHTSARVREVSRLIFGEDDSGNIVSFKTTSLGSMKQSASWTILGSERITNNAGHLHATIPSNTLMALVTAEGGDIRWLHNGDATATSPGYIPDNGTVPIFFGGITGLTFYGAAGTYANIIYYG